MANSENLYMLSKELRQLKEAATVVGLAGIKPKDRVTNITTMLRERIGKVNNTFVLFRHLRLSLFGKRFTPA